MSELSVTSVSLVVVTDVRLLREGLAQVLSGNDAVHIAGTASTFVEAVAAVVEHRPHVVLLDMSLPQCVDIGRAVHAAAPLVGIVAFAGDPDALEHLACVEAGIAGFVPRDGGVHDLTHAVVSVARGDAVCTPHLVASTFRRIATLAAAGHSSVPRPPAMSARERQIVELIDCGLSNKQIAQRLDIGVATVKNHVHHILEKLQVGRRGEAAARLRDAARRSVMP